MTFPDKWTKVTEGLPTLLPDNLLGLHVSRWLLVALSSKEICVARLKRWEDDEETTWEQWGRDNYECYPTHWMGLPEPPKE